MKPGTIEYKPVATLPARPDRGAIAFVWGIWLVMLCAAFVFLARFPRNIPFSEDWLLVPPLTGNEFNLLSWLWTQNNEHRIPFPRLILLALLKATHGDFRAGMFFNVLILGILASVMILVVRRIRGGRTRFADAFFPIALLHLGNWENMFWSWQLTQVIPTVLACVILLTLVGNQPFSSLGAAVAAGVSLILLPLSGANGLIFVPLLAPWLGYCGFRHWRLALAKGERQSSGRFLIGAALVALSLTGLYFVGYENPPHGAPSPGFSAALAATLKFLALSFGPVARSSWPLSIALALGLVFTSTSIAILAVLPRGDRYRALGILVFFCSLGVFAAAIGWGRARVLPLWGGIWPTRYVLLAVPVLFAAFFVWEIYGPKKLRTVVQYGLFLWMFVLIPFNSIHGYWWYQWYLAGVEPFERDLHAGMTPSELIARNGGFLTTWMHPDGDKLQMLQEAGIGLFVQMREDSPQPEAALPGAPAPQPQAQPSEHIADAALVTQEIRYDLPAASQVSLIWGIDGWRIAPEDLRPAGTEVKDNVMHTPMIYDGSAFVTRIWVPAGTPIDYCFLITDRRGLFNLVYPVCDGNYQVSASENSVAETSGTVTLNKDVSDVLDKKYYFLAGYSALLLTWVVLVFSIGLLETGLAMAVQSRLAMASILALVCISGGLLIYRLNSTENSSNSNMASAGQQSRLVTQEFRYRLPEAGEVYLVWGTNNWQIVPEEQRPPGTNIEFGVMNTPMALEGDTFVAKVRVPAGTVLDYGFQTRKTRSGVPVDKWIWDGDYRRAPVGDGVIEVKAAVTLAKK
jgi:hypothetical protein